MDTTGKQGKYWFDLSFCNDIISMIEYQRNVYNYIKNKDKYRAASNACFLINNLFDEVAEIFPLLETFRIKYNLDKRLSYLEYVEGRLYRHLPHDHESIGTSIFFPLVYSPYVGTAFFDPKEKDKIPFTPSKLGKAIGDPIDKVRYTCSYDTTPPVEIVGGNRPLLYDTSQLHGAVELETGHIENYNRTICAWDCKLSFNDMITEILNEK